MAKQIKPLFNLGQIVATPGALEALKDAKVMGSTLILRHWSGDWGDVHPDDAAENNLSVKQGFRILSAYTLPTGTRLWIITEADRSATTMLLPEEY